jgi:protein AATF/BFR2
LKTGNGIVVDAKYRGRTASRKDVFGENVISETGDLDDSNDDEEFEESGISSDESQSEEESSENEMMASESSSEESEDEEQDDDQQDRREKVRQMLAQETKSVAEQMSEATQADAEKGRDIKKQQVCIRRPIANRQRFYDSLLDARIRIQKALLALNSLPQGDAVEKYTNSETSTILKAAQEEVFTLFAKSFELRKVFSITT